MACKRSSIGRAAVLTMALLLAACGTPAAIQQLSKEQIQTQIALRSAVDASFAKMAAVVDNQLKAIEVDAERRNRAMLESAYDKVAAPSNRLSKDSYVSTVLGAISQRNLIVAQARVHAANLQTAQANVLKAFDTMIKAQQTLDDYLQKEQADERVVAELLGAVGISRQEVTRWFDAGVQSFTSARDILDALQKT